MLSRAADKRDRERAIANAPALAASLADYLRQRGKLEARMLGEELSTCRQVSIDIPALSPHCEKRLRACPGIHRSKRSSVRAGVRVCRQDDQGSAGRLYARDLRTFRRTNLPAPRSQRRGRRDLRTVTSGMNPRQKADVQSAWSLMRTGQQLAAHERSANAVKQTETLRQTKSQGLSPRW